MPIQRCSSISCIGGGRNSPSVDAAAQKLKGALSQPELRTLSTSTKSSGEDKCPKKCQDTKKKVKKKKKFILTANLTLTKYNLGIIYIVLTYIIFFFTKK